MTDPIPQAYLDEAVRRTVEGGYTSVSKNNAYVKLLARTLQELGWQPPVDPMLVRAREIANRTSTQLDFSAGFHDHTPAVRAALIALREGMGE